MMDQKGCNMFMDFLREKLETMVYADIAITEESYEGSSAIKIAIKQEGNVTWKFDWLISWIEFEYHCNSFGIEGYANLVSKKIFERYVNSILNHFVRDGAPVVVRITH